MYQLPVLCLLKPENSFYFMSQEQVSYGWLMPFSVQVMLLGFVLLGRSLEEKARIRASSDMNELLVSSNDFYIY
jgi:cation transport ATPase